MANIREFTQSKDQSEKTGLEGKIQHHRRSVFFRLLFLGLLVLGILGVLYLQWVNKVYKGYQTLTTVDKTDITGTETVELDGKILTYSKDGISCMDVK